MKIKHSLILASLLAFNTSVFALSPLAIGDAKEHFSKPYLEFVNAWMPQDMVTKIFNFGGGGALTEHKTFYAMNVDKFADSMVETFKAFCEANNGDFEKYSREVFCLNKERTKFPLGFMRWTNDGQNITKWFL